MEDLKDLLEKSNSLLKSQKVKVKPLERVLNESNTLLTELNKKIPTSKNYKGENMLYQEGFNVNNYLTSLRDLNLSQISSISDPSKGELSLTAFLEKEERYLILSCMDECSNITGNNFYRKINESLNESWKKEKRKKTVFEKDKYLSVKKHRIEVYSSIMLDFLRKNELRFAEILSSPDSYHSREKDEIVETYHFLSRLGQDMKRYLEDQYYRHVVQIINRVGLTKIETHHKPNEIIKMFLKIMFKKNFEDNHRDKWRVLYYLLRVGKEDPDWIKLNFPNRHIYDALFVENFKNDRKIVDSYKKKIKLIKNVYEQIVKVVLFGIKGENLSYKEFKIEDFLWYKCSLNFGENHLKKIIKVDCGLNYFKNEFLYFKLLFLVREYHEGIKKYREFFPKDILNYIHFCIILYIKGEFKGKEEEFYFVIDDFTNFLLQEFQLNQDALVYNLIIKEKDKKLKNLKRIIIKNFSVVTDKEFKYLIDFLSNFLEKKDMLELFKITQKKLEKNGKFYKSILLLFFLYKHFENKDYLQDILKQLNFLLYNAILNSEYENNVVGFSEEFINLVKGQNFLSVANDETLNFNNFLNLYKFLKLDSENRVNSVDQIINLNLLPFTLDQINSKVNNFLNFNYKLKSLFPKLILITLKVLNNSVSGEIQKNEDMKKILFQFISKIQNYMPSSFFGTIKFF